MAFCEYCGTKLEGSDHFCPTCGSEVDPSVPKQEGEKIEEQRSTVGAQTQNAFQSNRPEYSQSSAWSARNESSTELWSWLKQNSKRQLFFTEEASTLTEEAFVQKIGQKMQDNGVPAHIESRVVRWDRSDVHRRHYFIRPITSVVNPLSALVQFAHVGKFTFVEEKTFITPPNLPEPPMKPVPVPEKPLGTSLLILGVMIVLLGVLAYTFYLRDIAVAAIVVGFVLVAAGFCMGSGYRDAIAHNKKCEEQLKAWNKAWSDWQDSYFIHSFQEDTNGQLSRIFDSAYECIKQVSNEEFASVKSVEQEDATNINDLEQMIARRKEEYR